MTETAPITDLSFEQAMSELETIVAKLESGDVSLSQSIGFYERGEALRLHCEQQLKDAEARIEKIALAANGDAASAEPLDLDS